MLIPIIKESEQTLRDKFGWEVQFGKNSGAENSVVKHLHSSQLALLEGLKKEVEELPPAVVDQVESGDLSEWITKKSVISSLEESITYLKTKI